MEATSKHIQFGSIRLHPDTCQIEHARSSRKVAPRDMEVLLKLVEADGQVVSRDKLLLDVWKDVVVNEETVSLSISRIRTALDESAREPRIIQTILKRGYRAIAPGKRFKVSKGQMAFAIVSILLLIVTMLFLQVQSMYHQVSDAGL